MNIYDYFYYQLYKRLSKGWGGVLTDWRAYLVIGVIKIFIIINIYNIYNIITKTKGTIENPYVVVFPIAIIIGVIDYFTFYHHQRWKKIIAKYDKLPLYKNKIGGWIVFLFIMIIVFITIKTFTMYGEMMQIL